MNGRIRFFTVLGAAALVLIQLNGCSSSSSRRYPDGFETAIIEMAQRNELDDLILSEFDPEIREDVTYRFGNPAEQLHQIDLSLNNGYAKLADDIESGRYGCIDKKELSQYQGSEWSFRAIGFPNWVKSVQGYLLLERARSLKYEIMLLELIKREDAAPLLRERVELLRALVERITVMAREEEWRE